MIVLLTDYGLAGPYTGQVLNVLHQQAPGVPVISLFADLPIFNNHASSYLLPAYAAEFESNTVFLCVVDPGVGSKRRAIVIKADEHWFVGPDNGLFDVICKRASSIKRWEITEMPARLSASFHGRDLFAPAAAQLAMSKPAPGKPIQAPANRWQFVCDDLYEIIYIDHYGNGISGIRAQSLDKDAVLSVHDMTLKYRRTFSEAQPSESFWYENANGLVEVACRQQSAAQILRLSVGDSLEIVKLA